MSLTADLSIRHAALWEAMVTHPFVTEMGDGTLPVAKFRDYFIEDFVFVRDLVKMVALGISKAPGFAEATVLNRFLEGVLDPEGDLFERSFRQMGVSEEQYTSAAASPTTRAFGDFLVRTGHEGDFFDIATVLFVTEGTYPHGSEWARIPIPSVALGACCIAGPIARSAGEMLSRKCQKLSAWLSLAAMTASSSSSRSIAVSKTVSTRVSSPSVAQAGATSSINAYQACSFSSGLRVSGR